MEGGNFKVTIHLSCGLTVIHHIERAGRGLRAFISSLGDGLMVNEDEGVYVYPPGQVCRYLVEVVDEDAKVQTFTNQQGGAA